MVEFVRALTEAHAADGHSSSILVLSDEHPPVEQWAARIENFGDAKHLTRKRVADWLVRHRDRFDVVFVHGLWQLQTPAVAAAAARSNFPYYVFPHGMLDGWFRTARPVKHVQRQFRWWRTEYRALASSRGVIFISDDERRRSSNAFVPWRFREVVKKPEVRIPSVNREVASMLFLNRFPQLREKRLLLFLGRLEPMKGCQFILKAITHNRPPLHLILAGPTPDEHYLRRLRHLSQGLSVTYTGPLTGELKWGAYSSAEAFILPSLRESFGFAIAEALAMGVPVLSTPEASLANQAAEHGAAILEPPSEQGVTRMIRRWLTADHPTMRRNARKCFERLFELGRNARSLTEFVERDLSVRQEQER
jgi:glycosyltransferase involved in cell wall biosynthesis